VLPAFDPLVRVLPGAVVTEDVPPSEGVQHGVEVFGHAPPGAHRQDHDPLVAERRVLSRLPREAHVDGVVGVLMIPFGPAVPVDDGPAGDVEAHAAAPFVRVEVRPLSRKSLKFRHFSHILP